MRNIVEDFDPSTNVEGGSIDINDEAVVDAINRNISSVTASACVTPYVALEKVRKILAYYKIFLPQTVFLEGDEGNEVFDINQFGEKFGVTNDGEFKEKNSDGLYLYFEWMTNDDGMIDIFSEIVDEEELDEILADFDDEAEEDENDDSDGAEPSHDMYKAANMREETINELKMDKKTYISAMQRTTGYDADYSGEEGRVDRDKLIARAKKYKGAKFAKQLAGADQMTYRPNRSVVPGQWGSDKLSWREPSRKTKSGKADKRRLAALKASMKKGDYRKPSFKKRKLPEETQLGSYNVARMKKTEMDPDIRKGWTDYKNDQSEKRMSNAVKTTWMTSSNPTYRYMGRIKPYKETDSAAKKDATRDKFVGQQNTRDIRRNVPVTAKEEKNPLDTVPGPYLKTVRPKTEKKKRNEVAKLARREEKAAKKKKLSEDAAEDARQKRLAKLWGKDPKPKKKGKMAELIAGWPDEIKRVRASMQARSKAKNKE